MKTYTTKAYAEAFAKLTEEEIRNGKLEHETRTIVNESGTCQVNLTDEEVQEYLMVIGLGIQYDADVWIDTALGGLIKWLKSEEMLESTEPPTLGQHTPEPWEYRYSYSTDADHKRVIACVNGCKGIVDPETAIPELLAALEVCAHVIGHNDCSDGRTPNGFAVALDRARAAIAKATNS